MEQLLVINPGSTSTKIAVYKDDQPVYSKSISHSTKDLSRFNSIGDQYFFRKELIIDNLCQMGFPLSAFSCIVARGGILPPIHAGAYEINEDMVWQLRNAPIFEHASNLGALIAYEIAKHLGIPAYIYDAVAVDEMLPITKLTGWKEIENISHAHNLNMRATAIRYAKAHQKNYNDITVIVAHLGGGCSISLHHNGRIIDTINDEVGSFSPERAGSLPMGPFVRLIFQEGWDEKAVLKKLKSGGGFVSHLGTNNAQEVEAMALGGDPQAKLLYDAMVLNIAKNIARLMPVVNGQIDAVILTGGMAHSSYLTDSIRKRLSFVPAVECYPGENEMQSLAEGALRVLRNEEQAHIFHKVVE